MPEVTTENSYLPEAEAEAYFSERLYATAWQNAAQEDRQKSLIMATRLLDLNFTWKGEPVDKQQPLAFPRVGIGTPKAIQTAELELALLLLQTDLTKLPETAGIASVQVDTIKLELNPEDRNKLIPPQIIDLVLPYGTMHGELKPYFDVTR